MSTLSCPSTKKLGRGISRGTKSLREAILAAFEGTGTPVTVRQMFYLLSVAGAVDKTEAGYRQAQRQLLEMRREELIPYHWIADNTRWRRGATVWNTLGECLEHTAKFYRANLWRDVPAYVEIWCEKDALAGVLVPVTQPLNVDLMVARGYSSETFAFEAAQHLVRIRGQVSASGALDGKPCFIYYVGDFDPSGWNASETLERKLLEFVGADGIGVHFERLAVNPEQASHLPSRPTKEADTRTRGFYERFGNGTESVELDAIPPDDLRDMVFGAINRHLPYTALIDIEREEEAARETLAKIAKSWAA